MTKAATKEQPLSDLEIAKQKLMEQAERQSAEDAMQVARDLLKKNFPDVRPKALEVILAEEFDRRPKQQPHLSEKGMLQRTRRDGEMVDLEDMKYWKERFGDLLPAPKVNEGEVAIELALSGVGNLSVQSQLVKQWGPDRTAQLLSLVGGELGKIKSVPNAAAMKGNSAIDKASNPWGAKAWNVTEQGRVTRALGEEKARAICKAAGATWGQTRPPKE